MQYCNSLFANMPKGAEASAVTYSLIEAAKDNGLDPYRYLTWLMHEASMLDMSMDDQAARLIPINAPCAGSTRAFDTYNGCAHGLMSGFCLPG